MSEATLQTLAYDLGIEKMVRNMTEAEKAQLRYIQIMRSSTEWQTDMGRTLITPANALRVMRQQFIQLGRAIGKVFIPIIMEAMPYVIAMTQILSALAQKLANFLGYEIADIDYSGLGDVSAGITDIGDSADKTAEKLNTMLAPFDDLNVVQNQAKNASSGLGGIGGDLGIELPEYDALANLNEKFAEGVESAKKNLEKMLPIVTAIGGAFVLWKTGTKFLSLAKTLDGIKFASGSKSLLSMIGGASSLAGILAGVVGFIVMMGIELPKLSKAFDDVILNGKRISEVAKDFSALDAGIMTYFLSDPTGVSQLVLSVAGLGKVIDIFKKDAIESTDVLSRLGDKISDATKSDLKPLVKQFETLNESIVKIDLSGVVNDDDVATIRDNLSKLVAEITNKLDARKNKDLANLQPLAKYMDSSVYKEIVEDTNAFYKKQEEDARLYQEEMNRILVQAQGRELQEEELNKINEYRTKMLEIGVQTASEKSDEYYIIMHELKNNLGRLSVEQASEYIQQAKKTRDETIKKAEEQYKGVVAQAERLKDAKAISEQEYNAIVDSAKSARDETIKSADEQYSEIYDTTTDKLGKTSKYIDEETGEIKSNWEVFTDTIKSKFVESLENIKKESETKLEEIKNKFTEKFGTPEDWKKTFWTVVDGATSALNELKGLFDKWDAKLKLPHISWSTTDGYKTSGIVKKALEALNLPTTIPKLNVAWYQQGGYPTSGDLFFANENGIPEMVGRIGNQTAVANNDQITTSITNALMSALSQYDFGGGKSPTTIYIGNKKIYEGYGDYVADENDRYGTNMIKV